MTRQHSGGVDLTRKAAGSLRIGLGCMALTGIYGHVEMTVARATLRRALDLGVRLFDTAPLYGDGANEALLGEALAVEQDTFIVTKFGLLSNGDGALVRDSRPAAIRASVETSLKRLRRDCIDLLLQHRADPCTPDDEVAGVAADLIQEGKIAAFGLSGTSMERVKTMAAMVAVAAVQNELSVATPDRISEPGDTGRADIMYMVHSPLGRGLLTGRLEGAFASGDLRSCMPQFGPDVASDIERRVQAVEEVAARHATSREAVALAWVLGLGENVVPIPGARSPEQIESAAAASSLILSPQDVAYLTMEPNPL